MDHYVYEGERRGGRQTSVCVRERERETQGETERTSVFVREGKTSVCRGRKEGRQTSVCDGLVRVGDGIMCMGDGLVRVVGGQTSVWVERASVFVCVSVCWGSGRGWQHKVARQNIQ